MYVYFRNEYNGVHINVDKELIFKDCLHIQLDNDMFTLYIRTLYI